MKTLIVNADDFGFARDVNAGIIEAHRSGILTAATLMANGSAYEDAVRLAAENPTLDVGCHLVLVGGRSLLDPRRAFPASPAELVGKVLRGRISPLDELRAQVEKILGSGIPALHMDTHKHTHLFPPVLDAVARLSQEYKIPWVRRPFDFPRGAGDPPFAQRVLSRSLRTMRMRFHARLAARGCRTTDHFAGFQLTGRLRTAEMISVIEALPDGITEFMCHPGRCTHELRSLPTRLKESRETELAALTNAGVREALDRAGARLSGYREL